MSRRHVVALASVVLLAGCGWRPLYAVDTAGRGVDTALSGVAVDLIPERTGQLLRQALQTRLYGSGGPGTARYRLSVGYSVAQEGLGVLQDNSTTRLRLTARADYTLQAIGDVARTCVSGTARRLEGIDTANQQFFATDLAVEAAQRRLSDRVAEQIVERLATGLRTGGVRGCEI